VLSAVWCARLNCLQLVVARRVPLPRPELLYCVGAVTGGVEVLRYVRELGGVFGEEVAEASALLGDLEALKYARSCGGPWNDTTLGAAIVGDSLECLRHAHENGCPLDFDGDRRLEDVVHAGASSMAVLRYVCEHMDPTWVDAVLRCTVTNGPLGMVFPKSRHLCPTLHWEMLMYLGRKLEGRLPKHLAQELAAQKDWAAAIARIFWSAGKQAKLVERSGRGVQAGPAQRGREECKSWFVHPVTQEHVALWNAMASVDLTIFWSTLP
jgi:hypothetical protein